MKLTNYTTLPGLRLMREDGHEMELFIDQYSPNTLKGFTKIVHDESYGEMDFQYFIGEGFQIWRSHYLMHKELKGISSGDLALIELHIPLYGEAMSWWDGEKLQRLRPQQFSFDHVPFIQGKTIFHERHAMATLDIHFHRSFIIVFAEQYPIISDFLLQVDQGQRADLLGNAVRFLSPAMMEIIQEILHFTGPIHLAGEYYESRVIILLESVLQRAMQVKHDYSAKKYLDAAVTVREYIERHPSIMHTGKSLSAYTGINVSLLHKIFREYHGATLFDFGQGIRLEHGKQLIRDTSLYTQEIAELCGYPEHTNFSKAFRKRFGFTPQQYREALAKTGKK
jgi:AraC family transcriptional regulator, transcriptional activator of the genes for pyochelin and ferripyochelin receptors